MITEFQQAMQALRDSATAGTPVQIGDAREKALGTALAAMAAELGTSLESTHIDARGEFRVVVPAGTAADQRQGVCGHYGEAFAKWLCTVPTRTGAVAHTGYVLPENGWCYINHFDVERLVNTYEAETYGAI